MPAFSSVHAESDRKSAPALALVAFCDSHRRGRSMLPVGDRLPAFGASTSEKLEKVEERIGAAQEREGVLTSEIEAMADEISALEGQVSDAAQPGGGRRRRNSPPSRLSSTGPRPNCGWR